MQSFIFLVVGFVFVGIHVVAQTCNQYTCPGPREHHACCPTAAQCCGFACCRSYETCDAASTCVVATPPTPSPKPWTGGSLQWGAYLGGWLAAPITVEGLIIVSGSSAIYAVNVTGETVWRHSVSSIEGGAVPVVADQHRIYLYNGDSVQAIRGGTGAVVWTVQLQSTGAQNLIVQDGLVISSAANLKAIDAVTGTVQWTYSEMYMTDPPLASLPGLLFLNTGSGVIAIDSHTGNMTWNNSVVMPTSSLPMWGVGERVVVNCNSEGSGSLIGLSSTDGSVMWNHTYQAMGANPHHYNGIIYFVNTGDLSDPVMAIDAQSGATLWTWNDSDNGNEGNPSVEGAVTVGSETITLLQDMAFLYGISGSGELRWNISAAHFASRPPAFARGNIYAGVDSPIRGVVALNAVTGRTAWTYAAQDVCGAAPLAVGDTLYAACSDGFLYALQI